MRARLASATTRAVNAASRRLGRGQGTVAGGRAGLRVDPQLLEHLSAGRQVALVTGTNGKTTTTRLLTVALGATGDDVVSNETGSNMPPGHVAALAGTDAATRSCSRWTRSYLPRVLTATAADRRRAVEPLAGPARPHQRGAHGGGPLAGRAGRGAAHPRRGQRRRPAGGLGRRGGAATCTGWGPGCAGSSMRWAALVRGAHRLRRGDVVVHGVRLRPAACRRPTLVPAARRGRANGGVGRRADAPESGWRCPDGSTRPTR